MFEETLRRLLEAWDTAAPPETLRDCARYHELLITRGREHNLTALTDETEIAERMFLDSLALMKTELPAGATLVDIGTGAGFPGLVLRLFRPDLRVTLVESNGKKVAFLREVCEALELRDVAVMQARAEELGREPEHRERYDIAVSRAVAELRILAELCLPLVKVGGRFCAYKSARAEAELAAAGAAFRTLGAERCGETRYTLPLSGAELLVVEAEKRRATPAAYPRRYAQMKKRPL